MHISQISKNEQGTGLTNVLSYLYSVKPKAPITLEFNTNQGIKKLTVSWTVEGTKKGYSYVVPAEVTPNRKAITVFRTTQDEILPLIINVLYSMGFKDSTISGVIDHRDDVKVADLFDSDDFDVQALSETAGPKMGVLEVLRLLFSAGQKVYWPNDLEYKKLTGSEKEYAIPAGVKKIHFYKKLMGDTIIDSPLQELTNFKISSSSFNVLATGIQPIVLETEEGLIESVQYRSKILFSNGRVRVPYLYATIGPGVFKELVENNILEHGQYVTNKFYKIPLGKASADGENIISKLVSNKINLVPQNEVVNLAYDIEYGKVSQKVYKKAIKALAEKNSPFHSFVTDNKDEENLKYGLDKEGRYNPESQEKDTSDQMKTPVVHCKVSVDVVKFPATDTEKTITDLVQRTYLNDIDSLTAAQLIERKETVETQLKIIQDKLEADTFKLNLVIYNLYSNGYQEKDPIKYDLVDGESTINEPTKAKAVIGGTKKTRYFSNSDSKIQVRVQLFNEQELV